MALRQFQNRLAKLLQEIFSVQHAAHRVFEEFVKITVVD